MSTLHSIALHTEADAPYPIPEAAHGLYLREPTLGWRPATPEEVIEHAQVAIAAKLTRGVKMTSPELVRSYLTTTMATLERETFRLLMLDTQHQLIEALDLSVGTINATSVYPREVIRAVLACNSSAVICAHNHPSGNPEPSMADRALTERLKQALALIDVRLVDHLVVGGTRVESFAERGWV